MGHFYTNVTVVGASASAAARELAALGREAYVADLGRTCVVYDRESEKQDTQVLAALAERLATRLDARAFAVLDHDDDLLWFQLYDRDALVAEYANRGGPRTDVRALCRVLGRPGAVLAVWLLLHGPSFSRSRVTAGWRTGSGFPRPPSARASNASPAARSRPASGRIAWCGARAADA
jgi:hypothetical protein